MQGDLVDIDTQGALRLRQEKILLWDEQSGRILEVAEAEEIERRYPSLSIERLPAGALILPGAVDCHLHFPQTRQIGMNEADLLPWLSRWIWPEERRLRDPFLAEQIARSFLRHLLRQGTTAALVFGSQYPEANAHLFELGLTLGMSLALGETLQDQDGEAGFSTDRHAILAGVEEQIRTWHGRARLRYALTPRFSPSCSTELLHACGAIFAQQPDLLIQTHINESTAEIQRVREIFPDALDYLDTYERAQLLSPRTVFAHSIHTTAHEMGRMAAARCCIAHCPSSNAFLGSGAFPYRRHLAAGLRVGFGTDVGAGISFSLWREAGHAHLTQMRLPPEERLHLDGAAMLRALTVEGADVLGISHETGRLESGYWADFAIYHPRQGSYLAEMEDHLPIEQRLFRMAIAAEDEMIAATYIAGSLAYQRDPIPHWPWLDDLD
jgi:guanine deaminase